MSTHPDVIVVGAGLIGCAVAHALSRDGAAVGVLDAGALGVGAGVGAGASQASGGMLCPHIEGLHDPVLQSLGAESLERYDTFIQRVRNDAGQDVPYVRHGTLQVTPTTAGATALRHLCDRLHGQGVACQFLDGPDAVQEHEPLAAAQHAGLVIESHGAVRIRDLVEALRQASVHQGAVFHHAERVERIVRVGAGLLVETQARTFHAPQVVVTAGAWSMTLNVDGQPAIPTHPVRGQLLRLQMPQGGLRRVLWGPECYMVPWADEVLVGATEEQVGFDSRATVAGVLQLCTAAQRLVPALTDATFSEVRVGLRPGSPDGLPIIGASTRVPGLIYATGHFRNGALLAPLTADLVAAIVRSEATPVPPALASTRFTL